MCVCVCGSLRIPQWRGAGWLTAAADCAAGNTRLSEHGNCRGEETDPKKHKTGALESLDHIYRRKDIAYSGKCNDRIQILRELKRTSTHRIV